MPSITKMSGRGARKKPRSRGPGQKPRRPPKVDDARGIAKSLTAKRERDAAAKVKKARKKKKKNFAAKGASRVKKTGSGYNP